MDPDLPAIEGGKPERKGFLVFGEPSIGKEEISEVVKTLKSGWIGTGPKTIAFEKALAAHIGSKHCVSVNSCTAALHLSLIALGIKDNDEVITTPMTFAATANVILQERAKPVFSDIDRETMNIDPQKIAEKITPKTRAIMPVHFAGQPCDMDSIMKIAKENNLSVIEDAAHAVGAEYHGKKIGTIGDLTCFSFYPNKNMTTIEGGAVTTEKTEWAENIASNRLHGLSKDAWQRYSSKKLIISEAIYPGYKYNMTDVQASLGLHQLKKLDGFIKKREELAELYNKELKGTEGITLPKEISGIKHARHLYIILLDLEKLKIERNDFVSALRAENIGAGIHYTPIHIHPYYRKTFGFKKGDFPNAEHIGERTVSLPLQPGMEKEDVKGTANAVKKIISYYKK